MIIRSRKTVAIPPGETIKEQLQDRGLTQKEFAERMDMSEKHISKLINGEVQLTPETACRLEMVLGIPASFWNNLEAGYREDIIKANEENEMDNDIKLSQKIPYSEMVKRNWVPPAKKLSEKVRNLRKFFEVVNLEILNKPQIMRIACRRKATSEKNDLALFAWAQRAKLCARHIKISPVNIKRLEKNVPEIRDMTQNSPERVCENLKEKLADCGIALVFLSHIKGSFLNGASFYDGNKIVVGLTMRCHYADRFWFDLFHELAHVIKGHIGQQNGTSFKDEEDSNEYANEILIPQNKLTEFIEKNHITEQTIISFARTLNIDPGIIVERLQAEGKIDYDQFNNLRSKYSFLETEI